MRGELRSAPPRATLRQLETILNAAIHAIALAGVCITAATAGDLEDVGEVW